MAEPSPRNIGEFTLKSKAPHVLLLKAKDSTLTGVHFLRAIADQTTSTICTMAGAWLAAAYTTARMCGKSASTGI